MYRMPDMAASMDCMTLYSEIHNRGGGLAQRSVSPSPYTRAPPPPSLRTPWKILFVNLLEDLLCEDPALRLFLDRVIAVHSI